MLYPTTSIYYTIVTEKTLSELFKILQQSSLDGRSRCACEEQGQYEQLCTAQGPLARAM